MPTVQNDALKYTSDPRNDDDTEETAEWLGALDGVAQRQR
jgi:hypothetical protein